MIKKLAWLNCGVTVLGLVAPALALETSVGEAGINARRLHQAPYNLIGRKIGIGQVEIGRPGFFGLDKSVSSNSTLTLEQVFYRNSLAKADDNVDPHAAMVAGVMVSKDKALPGVAPGARLYSSAVGSPSVGGQAEECISAQHVAGQNGGDIRAINFSFGESLQRDSRNEAILDGNALLTQCIDWSARVHDVLYVIAGNQGTGGIPIPTDHYNGITTAYTTKRKGIFQKVDFANLSAMPEGPGRRLIKREINVGPRRAISLVAPGSKISVYDLEGKELEVSGTSFAAPHITASVALLQEFGDAAIRRVLKSRRIKLSRTNWSVDSRRHEVMKAVLLNSADKIQDHGDGLLLGMNRTILAKNNQNWLDSDAYKDSKIPLDIQMGTGHLDTFRAYQQFQPGQWSPNSVPVPPIGWDYNSTEKSSSQEYVLDQPLKEGSFVSLTLTWDRIVELQDTNLNQVYDLGESFRDRGLNNLDLYLMPVGEQDEAKSVCASVSDADSIEHIFCPVPVTGRYKIRVQYRQQVHEESQAYALAWWTVPDTVNEFRQRRW
ncbi:MAG: S8 family serine peptidase [Symploca sp. SIO2E9]|nr:S8 family serine peptidase [Symploca sp. SIO2E9]